jgi:hypothetical protein
MDIAAASDDLITRIGSISTSGSADQGVLETAARNYISSLPSSSEVVVSTITPTITAGQSVTQPIVFSGTAGTQEALVIDASSLPSGTIIQVNDIDFVAITGAVRVTGGSGSNVAYGDSSVQFMVLGADDDELHGGGGDDTIGSLGGNDRTYGDEGNDTVFGGSGNDLLSGGTGNNKLNGGFGIDRASLAGSRDDYSISTSGNGRVTLTQNSTGETTTLLDIERVDFDSGDTLCLASNYNEALGYHLFITWLGREPTDAESEAIQNWTGDSQAIIDAFLRYFAPESVQALSQDELLAGMETDPNILQLNAQRQINGNDDNNDAYLPTGLLGLRIDGTGGHDIIRLSGGRDDCHLEVQEGQLELTQLRDGSMALLQNIEMLAFSNGDTLVLAHNTVEGIIGRLYQAFLGRNATAEEWQAERAYIYSDQADAADLLARFQQQANSANLDDADYIQLLHQNSLGRQATSDEMADYQAKLDDGSLDRGWLAVDLVASDEAATAITGVMVVEGWV